MLSAHLCSVLSSPFASLHLCYFHLLINSIEQVLMHEVNPLLMSCSLAESANDGPSVCRTGMLQLISIPQLTGKIA